MNRYYEHSERPYYRTYADKCKERERWGARHRFATWATLAVVAGLLAVAVIVGN